MFLSKMKAAAPKRHLQHCVLTVLALVGFVPGLLLAQAPGSPIPPTLIYNPAAGTPITLNGVTQVGTSGSATINVTSTGGSGTGAGATTGLSCTLSGGNAANFTVMPPSQSFTPTSPPGAINLTCTSGAAVRTTTLACTESPGGATGQTRNWALTCPAGSVPNTPPTLAYQPAPGQPVVFTAPDPVVGGTATSQIRVTPSGGSGTGPDATTRISNCSVSNESVPNTFSGFQSVNLNFVGSTTTPQNINLNAVIRAAPVTGTLQCTETRGIVGPEGNNVFQRTWPLQSAAGRPNINQSLSINKSASASTVTANTEFSYTIDVTNTSSSTEPGTTPSPQNGIVMLDEVPAALTVVSASGAGWNCSVVGNAVDCRRSTLASGASASVEIVVLAPATAQTVVNTARATSVESRFPATSTVSVAITEDTTPPPPSVDLRLDKRDSADPVVVSTAFSYFLDVTNVGSSIASGVTVTDTLPAGVTLVAAGGPGWTCTGTATVSCTLEGSLPSGAVSTVTLQVRSPAEAGTLSNTARVTSAGNDVNGANDSDTEATVILAEPPPPPPPQADLAITAQAVPTTTVTGGSVELQLNVVNRGPDTAAAPILTGTFAQAFDIRSINGGQWVCAITGQTIRCTITSIAANVGSTIRVATVIRPGSTAAATASFAITATTADPVTTNNNATVTVAYQSGGADLAIAKSDSVDPVAAAAAFFYTLNVTNAGPEAAAGVRVSDTLPAGLTFVSATGAGFTCTGTGQTIVCNLGAALAAGGSASVQVNVRAPATGQSITNEASVGATTTDPNPANNRATQSTQINDRTAADLEALLDDAAVDPASRAALPVIAAECALNNASELAAVCRDIVAAADAGRVGEVTEALRGLSPDEVLAQSLVLREIGATQFFNVDARLNELRRGGGGFSLSGLNVQSGSQSIPLALVGDALQEALGFGESDGFGGLVSPWGFFINGSITDGEQDLNFARGKVGVDYQSRGITAGVDYRFNPRFVAGAAIGYANFDADVAAGSTLDTTSLMFTGYGSYYLSDRLYIDTRLSFGQAQLDQERRIHFQLGSTVYDALALGETDATQFTVASSMGYHLNYGAWSVTPSAGVRFTSSDVDAFDETNAGVYNVAYSEQSFDSVNFAVGIQFARAVSLSRGVLMPQFDISLNNESGDDASAEARLISGGVSQLFRLTEESPDSSYGTAGLGFVYLMGNGKQAYMSYRRMFGNDEMDRGSLNLGGRFEF